MLLDATQGARVSSSAYSPRRAPSLSLVGRRIAGWQAAVARAEKAPQLLSPGLLAGAIPGGGAYAGVVGAASGGDAGRIDAALAADRRGALATVSLGSANTLTRRIAALTTSHSLVVADLPGGLAGLGALRALLSARPPEEALIAVLLPRRANALLWIASAGLGGDGRTLTSQTTDERGMVAAIDIAPTILEHLALPVPDEMRGKRIEGHGRLDAAGLRSLRARLGVVAGRRLPALACLLAAWAALLMLAALLPRRGAMRAAAKSWAMRVGALALLWAPAGALVTAALEPSPVGEYALLAATCFALAIVTERLIPWPRAPIAPAAVVVVAVAIDALAGTQLLMRSLLGPNPAFGARFYGIGNELKAALAVLVLCAVAGALHPAERGRRAALTMALAGGALAVVEGAARIGAGVGAVILVSAGAAVATAMLLPGSLTRRRVLLVLLAPAAALVALAAIDLASAHGGGHFTGSILHARSATDVRDVIVRRYEAAFKELENHGMPFATALALLAGVLGLARRERLCSPVNGDPGWLAALCGGLTAGVVGTLSEDSGPVLLVVAVFALGCVLCYLWGRPRPSPPGGADRSGGAVPARAAQHDLVL